MPRAKRIGAPLGNQNAVGNLSKRKGSERERRKRVEADTIINLLVPDAALFCGSMLRGRELSFVRGRLVEGAVLDGITNMDRQKAADCILDRKIPKKTSAEVAMEGMPPITINIPGLNWPSMSADPEVIPVKGSRQIVLDALKDEANGA